MTLPATLQLRLAEIVATAMDAIVAVDAQQRVVLFNDAAVRMFGLPAEQALGQPLERLIPVAFRDAHRAHVQRYAHGDGAARPMGSVRALTGLRADGTEFPLEASISRLGHGPDVLMTAMIRDVTEVREAERARQQHAASEAARQVRSEFFTRMGQEMRTPLQALVGMSRLLRSTLDERLAPAERAQFDVLQASGEQLRQLIDNVLDLARLEAGEDQLEAAEVDLCTVLDRALHSQAALAAVHEVRLEADHDHARPCLVQLDAARVEQLVANLLSAAIRASRPGGSVRLALTRAQGQVRISVGDRHDAAAPARLQPSLFEPFQGLAPDDASGGSGLNLTLVRQLAALMGGGLDVENHPGQGRSMHLTLPADAAAQDPSGTVLYIEDNPVNALLVVEVLRQWPDVRVVVADTGSAGLRQARALQPDVVLLDMHLPDLHGLQVLEQLQADPTTRHLPVAALSANAMPNDVALALAAGARAYWTKPIDFAPFLQAMRELLRKPPTPPAP